MSRIESEKKRQIKNLIMGKIETKLNSYAAETTYRPFFSSIFPEEVIAQASIMQSLYTSFGMSIYEQIAVILGNRNDCVATRQYSIQGQIDDNTMLLIDDLSDGDLSRYSKVEEIELIRESIREGASLSFPDGTADVFLYDGNREVYVDITTVKPNKKETHEH